MLKRVHVVAGVAAMLLIALFFASTILTELFATHETVARFKALIVMPGLLLLIPSVAAAGGSGFTLAKGRRGKMTEGKKRRMRLIGANGLLVLVPCAVMLSRWAAVGRFDPLFYALQAIEVSAGALNLVLLGRNMRDGLLMTGRLKPKRPVGASA